MTNSEQGEARRYRVAAVVVTWNSARDIVKCLDSLMAQSYPVEKIVVVDNGSSDGTPDLVAERFPKVMLTRMKENIGFAQGNNIGIEATDTEWVLTLNPDAYLSGDFVERLLEFGQNRPRIGMLGGKLFRADSAAAGDGIIDSTGIEIYLSRRVKDRDAGTREQDAHKVPDRVFGVCAAAALYRREMLDDVSAGGEFFPASFFCYYEDADLAWRAWRRGWEAWFVPAALGWHRRGGAPVGSRFSRYYTQRNRLWLVARNEPLWKPLAALPALGWHELLLGLRLIRYPYLLKAVWESIRGLPAALRARARLPEINREPPPFHPGSGFSLKELVQVLQRKKSCNT